MCKHCVHGEWALAVRVLLGSVPSALASDVAWADYKLRKAEVADFAPLADPASVAYAKSLATRSRYQARGLIVDLAT